MTTKEIRINGEGFILHPCGTVYWISQKMLLIADVHLGKVTHFRKAGVAVPTDSINRNFERLDNLIDYFDPETICFLGDLFHSYINSEWDLFSKWVCKVKREIILIMGNHDIIAHSKFCDIDVAIFHEIAKDGFLLTHKPEIRNGYFNFAGHIHPCVRLRGKGRQFLKLSCFYMKSDQMILPAFGEFTGTHEMTPEEGDSIFAIADGDVMEVSVQRERRA